MGSAPSSLMVGHRQSPAKLGMYMHRHRSLLWKHDTEVRPVPIFLLLVCEILTSASFIFSNLLTSALFHLITSSDIFSHLLALSVLSIYAWLYRIIFGTRSWSGCEIARVMLGISSSPWRPQMWRRIWRFVVVTWHEACASSIALGVALGSRLKGDFGDGTDSLLDPWSSDLAGTIEKTEMISCA